MNISFMRSVVLGCLFGLLFFAVVFADYHYASHIGVNKAPTPYGKQLLTASTQYLSFEIGDGKTGG